jgi:hypothetical protein
LDVGERLGQKLVEPVAHDLDDQSWFPVNARRQPPRSPHIELPFLDILHQETGRQSDDVGVKFWLYAEWMVFLLCVLARMCAANGDLGAILRKALAY